MAPIDKSVNGGGQERRLVSLLSKCFSVDAAAGSAFAEFGESVSVHRALCALGALCKAGAYRAFGLAARGKSDWPRARDVATSTAAPCAGYASAWAKWRERRRTVIASAASMSSSSLALPGSLFIGPDDRNRLVAHTGAAAGWFAPLGILRWSTEVSLVARDALTEDVRRIAKIVLPIEQIPPARMPFVAKAAGKSPLVAVTSKLVGKLGELGIRVHTVGVDRITSSFYYLAEGGGEPPVHVSGDLVQAVAAMLGERADNAAIERVLDGLADRLLRALSNDRVTELAVELAARLPRAASDGGGTSGLDLGAFEKEAAALAFDSSSAHDSAREIARKLAEAAERSVAIPVFGEARKVSQGPFDLTVGDVRVSLATHERWVVGASAAAIASARGSSSVAPEARVGSGANRPADEGAALAVLLTETELASKTTAANGDLREASLVEPVAPQVSAMPGEAGPPPVREESDAVTGGELVPPAVSPALEQATALQSQQEASEHAIRTEAERLTIDDSMENAIEASQLHEQHREPEGADGGAIAAAEVDVPAHAVALPGEAGELAAQPSVDVSTHDGEHSSDDVAQPAPDESAVGAAESDQAGSHDADDVGASASASDELPADQEPPSESPASAATSVSSGSAQTARPSQAPNAHTKQAAKAGGKKRKSKKPGAAPARLPAHLTQPASPASSAPAPISLAASSSPAGVEAAASANASASKRIAPPFVVAAVLIAAAVVAWLVSR